jgi:hypothetical protein
MGPGSRKKALGFLVSSFFLIAAPAASLRAGEELRTGWWSGEAAIDGSLSPWAGVMSEIGEAGLLVGVVNDGEYVYLCLKSPDPGVLRQAMMRGLTVRLEPKGGEPFALQYPIGLHSSGGRPPGGETQEDREKLWTEARDSLDTFLLSDASSREPVRFAAENGFGIRLYVSPPGEGFIYQAKIPLHSSQSHPHALGAEPGSRLTLYVETPEREHEGMEGRPEGGGHGGRGYGGGRGGGGGGYGGHGGGMHGGGGHGPDSGSRLGMLPPLKVKIKLQLASPGAAGAAGAPGPTPH